MCEIGYYLHGVTMYFFEAVNTHLIKITLGKIILPSVYNSFCKEIFPEFTRVLAY